MVRGNITRAMVKQHIKLHWILVHLRMYADQNNVEMVKKKIKEFKKKQKIHIVAEERWLISMAKGSKEKNLAIKIKKQHKMVPKLLEDIDKTIKQKRNVQVPTLRLQEFMGEHLRLEENRFYPELDKRLQDTDVEKIIKKLK